MAAIHQEGIDTGFATFEIAPPRSWEDRQKSKINGCSLVARDDNRGVGWAALSAVSSRPCYAGVAEVSIYVGKTARGKGIGSLSQGENRKVTHYHCTTATDRGIWRPRGDSNARPTA